MRDGSSLPINRTSLSGAIIFYQDAPYLNFIEKESYSRRISLESALAEAKPAASPKCGNAKPAHSEEKVVKYDSGAMIGMSGYAQITRCVFFFADLSGDFFKELERFRTPNGYGFHKKGRPIATYPASVTLEVGPLIASCEKGLNTDFPTGIRPSTLSRALEFRELRFHIRWTAAITRDLGEVPSRLLTEPWPELEPPSEFYRLELPAQDVPLSDTLEIEILSKDGEPIACIAGQI